MFKLISLLLIAAALTGCGTMTDAGNSDYIGNRLQDSIQQTTTRYYKTRDKSCPVFTEKMYNMSTYKRFILNCDNRIVAVRLDDEPTPPVYSRIVEVDREIKAEEYAADEPNRIAAEKARLKAEKAKKQQEAREVAKAKAAQVDKARANGGFIVTHVGNCALNPKEITASNGFEMLVALAGAVHQGVCDAGTRYNMNVGGYLLNDSPLPRKDVKVVCVVMAKSGTMLSSKTSTIYESWAPNELKKVYIPMDKPAQGHTANCRVISFN